MAPQHPSFVTPFGKRAETAAHPLTAYLYRLMEHKSSNLCLSADVSTARELLQLADRVGPSIVVLKTHYDIVSGWDYNPHTGTGVQLAALARKHGFLLFEDRKFADIGKTSQQQYTAGTARIIDWAHLVTVNMDAGSAAVSALADAAARWRERIHYGVKTSVSVGTPIDDSEDDDREEGGEPTENDDSAQPLPWADQTAADSSSSNSKGLPPPPGRANEGRKGSIVSITTVTQHFEPADSPRLPEGSEPGVNGSTSSRPRSPGGGCADVLAGIEEAPIERGILLLAQMSSKGNLMTPAYTQACVDAARAHPTFVVGFIAQTSLNTLPDDTFVHLTPGCKLPPSPEEEEADAAKTDGNSSALAGDGLGQQYNTPAKLVGICGSDIVIVGRGIITACDPPSEAERYRRRAWKAYLGRLAQ